MLHLNRGEIKQLLLHRHWSGYLDIHSDGRWDVRQSCANRSSKGLYFIWSTIDLFDFDRLLSNEFFDRTINFFRLIFKFCCEDFFGYIGRFILIFI